MLEVSYTSLKTSSILTALCFIMQRSSVRPSLYPPHTRDLVIVQYHTDFIFVKSKECYNHKSVYTVCKCMQCDTLHAKLAEL